MINKSALSFFKEWESTGEIDIQLFKLIEEQFADLAEKELNEIRTIIPSQPYVAFMRLALFTSFLNSVASKIPSLIKRLEKWVQKVQIVADVLAKKLGANGFSIGVGAPVAISIELSFPLSP